MYHSEQNQQLLNRYMSQFQTLRDYGRNTNISVFSCGSAGRQKWNMTVFFWVVRLCGPWWMECHRLVGTLLQHAQLICITSQPRKPQYTFSLLWTSHISYCEGRMRVTGSRNVSALGFSKKVFLDYMSNCVVFNKTTALSLWHMWSSEY
jgi:hypothetical protein